MAFVALTASSITFRGASGKLYGPYSLEKSTAVGFETINGTNDFWIAPEDVWIIDIVNANASNENAGDYHQLYINGEAKPQKFMAKSLAPDNSPRLPTPVGPIKAGSMIQLYWYSA